MYTNRKSLSSLLALSLSSERERRESNGGKNKSLINQTKKWTINGCTYFPLEWYSSLAMQGTLRSRTDPSRWRLSVIVQTHCIELTNVLSNKNENGDAFCRIQNDQHENTKLHDVCGVRMIAAHCTLRIADCYYDDIMTMRRHRDSSTFSWKKKTRNRYATNRKKNSFILLFFQQNSERLASAWCVFVSRTPCMRLYRLVECTMYTYT